MSKSGKCLCGAVTFSATPSSDEVGVCHCDMCRKVNAGPFLGVDCADTLAVTNKASLGVYSSSDWGERGFCKECGSSLFWRTKDGKMNVVSVDAFEHLDGLKLDHEIFIDNKPNYYSFAEPTKKMTGEDVMKMFMEGSQ